MEHEKKEIEEQENQEEEESILGTSKPTLKKKKLHPFRWFILLMLLLIAALYIQQWYLDIEAEALVYAKLTASAFPSASAQEIEKGLAPTEAPTLISATATSDQNLKYTQTVAVQLTDVAEFQQTPSEE